MTKKTKKKRKFNEIQMNKQTNRDANERNHKTDADKIKAHKKNVLDKHKIS